MKFKHKNLIIALVCLLAVFLTACSAEKSKNKGNTLPSSKTILTKAQKENFKSLQANWVEKDRTKTLQKAEVKYTLKPTVVYADVAAESNHYKMWLENKNSYIQMKGTRTKRWFKTKSESNTYSSLVKNLNGNLLTPFVSLSKQFKVKQNGTGYQLSYQGKSRKVWNAIVSNAGITSLIGIDIDDVKPIASEIQITTDRDYQVTGVKIASTYKDDGEKKSFKMQVDQINKVEKLSVPTSVKKAAIDLGKIGQK